MKLPSIFLFTLIMTNQVHSQLQSSSNEFSSEKKVMLDCDQRVFYEIFVRSFYDSNDDGIGDLNGITMKLDYLQQLGIGGLWLTPFNPSPSYHKYDVTDYYGVDPQYGTLDDFKRLVSEAHKRNILVLLDLVVNHTSWQHPWFKAAVQHDPKYRDYFSWEKNPAETKEGNWYYPNAAPVIFGDGKLYGVTVYGGANMAGVIYSFDIDNGIYTDVYDFANSSGSSPYGGLIAATNGKLYGMTYSGGANSQGVIYSFDPSNNTYENVYDFDGTNGGQSKATFMQGSNGTLYGLTTGGGVNDDGVVFSFEPYSNTYTKLYDFSSSDGSAPLGNLMEAGTVLCGTTSMGGDYSHGTVFNYNLETNGYDKLIDFNMLNGSNPNGGFVMLGSEIGTGVQTPASVQLVVYPNPVTQYAICSVPSIENGKVDIVITDVCGKEVFAQQAVVNASRLRIDLGNLSSGVYNLEVRAGNEKMVTKLLKD